MRLTVAAFVFALAGLPALADDAPAPGSFYGDLQQAPLTEDQVKNYVAAMPDMQAAMGDAPADAAEPDAKTMAKLETVAKQHGFKDFNEYNSVAGNVALALDGVDPETKTYVGADKLIERSMAEVKADKKMSDADKKSALADLQQQLKSVTPVKNKGNIDLVVKYYDKLKNDD
jgi:hypothetical protein